MKDCLVEDSPPSRCHGRHEGGVEGAGGSQSYGAKSESSSVRFDCFEACKSTGQDHLVRGVVVGDHHCTVDCIEQATDDVGGGEHSGHGPWGLVTSLAEKPTAGLTEAKERVVVEDPGDREA